MSTNKENTGKRRFLSFEMAVLIMALFGMVAIFLEKPVGSIKGQIAMAEENFGLYSYNIRQNKVFAVATGPRFGQSISRGVWVSGDGTFEISQLPVGEYSLRVRAPGFQSHYENSVLVEEGKVADLGKTIKMAVLEPYITIGSNTRVFTTGEAPHFWVNATGAVEATIKIYKKDIVAEMSSPNFLQAGVDVSSDLSLYTTYGSKFHNPYAEEKPYRQLKRELNASYSDSARASFKLEKGMEQGDYVVIAEAADVTGKKRVSSVSWFSVSDIGLVVKHSPDQTMVRAINLKTLKPIEGAEIELNNRGGKTENYKLQQVATASTDKSGIAMIAVNTEGAGSIKRSESNMVIGRFAGGTAYGGVSYWHGSETDYKTYFYTDRPVYRLGQTVSYKLITRELTTKGIVNPGANLPINVVVEDPTNTKLAESNINTTAHGSASGNFNIPEDGKTGGYQIRFTYPSGSTSYQSFEVEQYRKPEYKVEIIPNSKRYLAGGKVQARVKATYFFGGPVANARVKYSVYESADSWTRYKLEPRPDYYEFFDDWYEETYYDQGSYDGDGGGGAMVSEGSSTTDENGEALIEFTARPIKAERNRPYFYYDYGDKNYKIEADITDISRLTVTSSASTLVTAGDFALFVEPESYVVSAGQPMGAVVRALDYDGKAISGQNIKVKLSRWPWNSKDSTYGQEKVLGETTAVTGQNGEARISFNVADTFPTDTFYVTAEATDKSGHKICYGDSIWVASSKVPYVLSEGSAEKESFKITLDKKVYEPGEKAKLMISGPFQGNEGLDALITIEGVKIHQYLVKPLTASANLIELDIKDAYSPNVYVSVVAIGKNRQFFNQTKAIQVSPDNHFIDIKVETNKEKYKPGETASYRITAKYQKSGKPAPGCELSLGVVDESIYSIRSDSTADIRKFFYQKQYNWVQTVNSFPEQYSGGPDKAIPQIRKNFKDTAAWFPNLLTDKNGEVVAQVTLPDNLTTWRATVRGVSTGCDIGSAVQKILVTKDIIARLALPRFFTRGDHGEISAIVHNYSDRDQNIELKLETGPHFKTTLPLAKTLSVGKDKAARLIWPVSVEKTGTGKITLIARGETGSDALEKEIKINPFGLSMVMVKAGVLTAANNKVDLNFDLPPSISELKSTLRLAGSTMAQLKGSYAGLIDYPYGCTEQTMSRLVPSIVAFKLHQKFKFNLTPDNLTKFEEVKEKALKKLKEHQHYDGGWGWWADDASDPYLTAHVLEGFKLLSESGVQIEPSMIQNGLKWLSASTVNLHKALLDPKLVEGYTARERRCDLARMVYTQTLYGIKPDTKIMKWLDGRVENLTPEPLSYLTMANARLGNKSYADHAYKRLIELATVGDQFIDWEHNQAMRKRLKLLDVHDYTYRYTGAETTALALKAMVAMEPGNLERIEKVKAWIMLQRSEEGWSNTKTTAQVLLSLMDEAIKTGNTETSDVVAKILKDDSLLNSLAFAPASIYRQEETLNMTGDKNLSLAMDGNGRLYYQSINRFYKSLKPGEKLKVANSPNGLQVRREFFRLKTSATKSDGILKLTTLPLNDGSIKAGEILLMKVYVESPVSLPYVIVECPLPSGAEVVKDSARDENVGDSENESGSGIEGDWGSPWWSHQDILDDKMVFFGTQINQGKSEFHTLLRMELPGDVQLNPVTLDGMYSNMIHGYSQPRELHIK